jgi:hypothetical protein
MPGNLTFVDRAFILHDIGHDISQCGVNRHFMGFVYIRHLVLCFPIDCDLEQLLLLGLEDGIVSLPSYVLPR